MAQSLTPFEFPVYLRENAEVVSLQQDMSKGWLVIQYRASDSRLQESFGYLGACHVPTELSHVHSVAIRQATELVLDELGSPVCKMPFSKTPRAKYSKFADRLKSKVECLTADGASDEQKALLAMFDGMLPNLKLTCRDLPHCMRRVASRTTFADTYLKKVFLDSC